MVPAQRATRTQGRKRRTHGALQPSGFTRCPNCGAYKQHHRACGECGYLPPRSGRQDGLMLKIGKEA